MESNNCNVNEPLQFMPDEVTRLLDQMPDPYCIKNSESRIIYANEPMAKEIFTVKSSKDLIGKLDCEIDSKLEEFDNPIEFVKQDRQVMHSKKSITTLEIQPQAVDYFFTVHKIPLLNKENQCYGVLVYTRKLDVSYLNYDVFKRVPGSLLMNKPDDFFTEKESEIIFFKLQGLTSKEVADRLNISTHAIESLVKDLYHKCEVEYYDEFEKFCRDKNYHRYLPKRLLHIEHIDFTY